MEAFPFRAVALSESYDGIDKIPVSIVLDRVRSLYNVRIVFSDRRCIGRREALFDGVYRLAAT